MKPFLAAFRHELLLRKAQPWALFMFAATALLFGPGGMVVMDAWFSVAGDAVSASTEGVDLPIVAEPPIDSWIRDGDGLEVRTEGEVTTDDELEEGESYLRVKLVAGQVFLLRAMRVVKGSEAQKRFDDVLDRVNEERRVAELARVGIDPADYEIDVELVGEETGSKAGEAAGRLLPPILVFLLVTVGLYAAVDTLTAEKEKGTAETLLTTRTDRRSLLGAKFAIVWLLTAGVGWLWAVSLFVSSTLDVLSGVFAEDAVFTLTNTLALCLLVALLSTLVAAVSMLVAAWVPNFRQASVASIPAMLVLTAPTAVAALPNMELTPLMILVPVANVSLALRAFMSGELFGSTAALVAVATTFHAGLALAGATWFMDRIDPLDKGQDADTRRAAGNYAPDAFGLFVVVALMFWFFGLLSQTVSLLPGLIFTQIAVFGGTALVGVWYVGAPLVETFSLRLPTLRDTVLAVIVGATMVSIGNLTGFLMSPIAPMRTEVADGLLKLAENPLPLLLFAGALLPGVFEELVCRGALLGMLRTRVGVGLSIAVSSVMFGLLHVDLARVFVTGAMGVVLAVLLVRSGSIVPGMIAHATNNGILFTLAWVYLDEAGEPPETTWGVLGFWLCLAVVCITALSLVRGRSTPARARGVRPES